MEPEWVALLAAFVASLLTGTFSLAVTLVALGRQGRQRALSDRRAAHLGVLHASSALIAYAQALQVLLKTRGNFNDTLGLLLRIRLPLNETDLLHDYQQALTRILDAQDTLASVGSQAAIDAGEALCVAGVDYLNTCLKTTRLQRVAHPLSGWRPTRSQKKAAKAALRRVFEKRAALVHLLRIESGEPAVTLGVERTDQPG